MLYLNWVFSGSFILKQDRMGLRECSALSRNLRSNKVGSQLNPCLVTLYRLGNLDHSFIGTKAQK